MRLLRYPGVWGVLWLLLVAGSGSLRAAPPPPAAPPGGPSPPARTVPRLALTTYYYWYQADPRKPVPLSHTRRSDGSSALVAHPWDGSGPWFSYDRVQWHKNQLQLIRDSGIDVILPVYAGGGGSGAPYAVKGLDCLATALKELRLEGIQPYRHQSGYPMVGMWLDLSAVREALGGPVDLTTENGKRALYDAVRTFYRHVPREFRASVPLGTAGERGSPEASARAHIVVLAGAAALKQWDAAALAYCNRRFKQEFEAGLLWVGGPDLAEKAPGLDAYSQLAIPPGAGTDGAAQAGAPARGKVKIATIVPLARPAEAGSRTALASDRLAGQAFIQNFLAALRSNPDWILIQSWDQFENDTNVAPSLEAGLQPRDLTTAGLTQFRSSGDYGAIILRAAVPEVMAPRTLYQVPVMVENAGQKSWGSLNRAGLSYRWFQDGKQVGDAGPLLTATGVVPGATRPLTIGLLSPMSGSHPLPDGRYELRLDMMVPPDQWFGGPDSAPLSVVVEVGKPPAVRPSWLNSDLPAMVKSGATYTTTMRLRNDGSDTWRKGSGLALGYRWRRVAAFRGASTPEPDAPGTTAMASVPIPADVPPGAIIPVPVSVKVVDEHGAPLPVWSAGDGWSYDLEWGFFDGRSWITEPGTTFREAVAVLPTDPGPYFIGASLGSTLSAGQVISTNVGLRNAGPETWKMAEASLGYHWFYFDGTEAVWSGGTAPLPRDVAPGETVIVRELSVQVPDYSGPMYFVSDLRLGDSYASTGANTRGSDIFVLPVLITGGRMLEVNLSGVFNTDGISSEINRSDGDLDGKGGTLPAELLPPYVWRPSSGGSPLLTSLYPCGLWERPAGTAPGADGPKPDTVTFHFPEKRDRAMNVVSCSGQRVELPAGNQVAIHLLGCATAPDAAGNFTLVYKDGSTDQRPLTMSLWTAPPSHGEHTAFHCAYRHTPQGDDVARGAYLNHYTLPVDRTRPLAALLLPQNPDMKLLAITVESTELHPAPPTSGLQLNLPPVTQPTRRKR